MLSRLFLTIVFLVTASAGFAHEFWIEPKEYQVQGGAPLVANLRNGQKFSGISLGYFSRDTARFDLIQAGHITPVQGRMGDVPALQSTAPDDGLLVIVHQTTPSDLTYAKWEKFQAFADHKSFADIRARHDARGLPDAGFTETYTRYAKALVGVGDSHGADVVTGMETEFVALTNPYTGAAADGFDVQLLYQGAPRANAQIEVFDRSPQSMVAITLYHTDAQGRAVIPISPGHTYLLDAVVLREPSKDGKAVWQTLWAALSFAVPG
ncbi:MAG: cobalt/nickel transport protein [Paracoccaceae bacterium]|jgi:cobalt/nickel transport protein